LLYAGFASLWILLSDKAVELLLTDPAKIILASTLKGWVFVAVTSILLYGLIRRLLDGLQKSEERFRLAMEATNDGLWDWDIDTNNVYFSPGYYRILEYEPNEFQMTSQEWTDRIHPDDKEKALQANNDCIYNKTASFEVEFRMKTKTGSWKWVLGRGKTVSRGADGKAIRMVGTHVDITERKQIEEALRESEEKYRIIFNNEIFAICIFDIETLQLLDVNDAHVTMYGYSREELLSGMRALELSAEPEASKASVGAINQKGTLFVPLRYHRKKDGTTFPVEIAARPYIWRGRKVMSALVHEISDRMTAEATIQREKVFTNAVFDSVPGLLYMYDENGYLIRWNKKLEELTGYSAEELSHMHVLDWFKGDEKEVAIIKGSVEKALREGFADAEARLTIKDGFRIPFYFTAVSLAIDGKNYYVGIGTDITKRMMAEEELKLKSFTIDNLAEEVFWMTRNGRIWNVNDVACEKLGYTREELLSLSVADIDPFVPNKAWQAYWDNLKRSGSLQFESFHKTKDGRVFPVEIIAKYFNYNGLEYDCAIARDVTQHKNLEKALQASEELFRTLCDFAPIGIVRTDSEGHIIYSNPSMKKITGTPAPELTGERWIKLIHPEDFEEVTKVIERATKTGSLFSLEHRVLTLQGKTLWVRALGTPLKSPDDVFLGHVGTVEDITEQKNLEAQLRQAQKMEAVGQLAGGIAHDFNNILSAIVGYAYLLQSRLRSDDPSKDDVEQIIESANRAAEVTHSLLTFSKKQNINTKIVFVTDLVKRFEKMLSRVIGEDITISTELSCNEVRCMVDAGQIEQVLMNLATNARDAMPKGGKLTLSTKCVDMDEVFIRANGYGRSGRFALISVSDTGVGMNNDTATKIFEPFFTTKETGKGTGLGLAMAYGIIKQHNGYIDVYSDVGKGTTFNIYIPAADSKEEEIPIAAESLPAGGTETILVSEDDEKLRKLYKTILKQQGYEVILANNGEEAIEKFVENKDRIHLVLLDMIMPRKSGKEVYDEIKRIKPEMKVIFVSGYTADRLNKESLAGEGVDFIFKPASPKELLRKVRDMLDK
jgi:PAS domain S-box-containing protein